MTRVVPSSDPDGLGPFQSTKVYQGGQLISNAHTPAASVLLVQRCEGETFLVTDDAWTMSSSSQWVLAITIKQNFESFL